MGLCIYLAGPIRGLTYEQATEWRDKAERELTLKGFRVRSPMRNKEHLANVTSIAGSYENVVGSRSHEIFTRDKFDVEQSDIIIYNMGLAQDFSIGTTFELAWAHMLGKFNVMVMPKNTPYDHPFVREAASIVFENMDDALSFVIGSFGGK